MNSALVGIGLIMVLIGGLSVAGYIPNLTPQSTAPLCVQSIAKLATVCAGVFPTGIDSISYAGTIIAPVLNSNPVSIPQSLSQGELRAYYFLSSGVSLSQYSGTYCSGLGCSPSTPLSGITKGTTSAGVPYLASQSPQMAVNGYYTYRFSITDSVGVSSRLSGTVQIIAATPTWTATVRTLNGTFSIGGSSQGPFVSGVNVYNAEAPFFQVKITNNAPVSGVSIAVVPGGQTIGLSYVGSGTWQGTATFAVGQYTLTGTIASGTQQVTAFSIRLTSINQNILTQPTLTTYRNTCTSATQTIGNTVYVCQVTTTASLTITDSSCFTGTATTTSSTTIQSTTCSTITNVCGPNGCTGTTTQSTTVQTTSSGTTSTSTTASTTTQTESTSTTEVCTTAVCPGAGVNWVGIMLLLGGAVTLIFGFARKDDE